MKLKDLIIEKKEDVIKVPGVGIFTYKTLKKNEFLKMNGRTRKQIEKKKRNK